MHLGNRHFPYVLRAEEENRGSVDHTQPGQPHDKRLNAEVQTNEARLVAHC